MFSVEERDRVQELLLERADADARVATATIVGAEARGTADRWSDVDLTFRLSEGAGVGEVLADWTRDLAAELDAVDVFDLRVGSTVYRVFLLPGNLQVDLSFTPAGEVGARPAGPPPARELFGLGAHHAVRARICIERGRSWQAEYWISALRDHALELACRRRGLQTAYARGFDDLPAEVREEFEPALVRSLERAELLRALDAALHVLLREADEARELADKLEPRLRELTGKP